MLHKTTIKFKHTEANFSGTLKMLITYSCATRDSWCSKLYITVVCNIMQHKWTSLNGHNKSVGTFIPNLQYQIMIKTNHIHIYILCSVPLCVINISSISVINLSLSKTFKLHTLQRIAISCLHYYRNLCAIVCVTTMSTVLSSVVKASKASLATAE